MFKDASSNFNVIRPEMHSPCLLCPSPSFKLENMKHSQQKYAKDWLSTAREYYWILSRYLDIDIGWSTGENDGTIYDRKLLGAVWKNYSYTILTEVGVLLILDKQIISDA